MQGIRELLIEVARPSGSDQRIAGLVQNVDADDLVSAARRHRVVSLVHDRLRRVESVPRGTLDALGRPRLAAQAQRHLLHLALERALAVIGVPALVMKGHVLAHEWYPAPESRDFNDVDVVVDVRDFASAVASLEANGFSAAVVNWHGFLAEGIAEIPLHQGSAVIDLHWNVVQRSAVRRHLVLPTADLFARSVPGHTGRVAVRTLGPEDTLLHLCVNMGLGGGRRLRGLIDIAAVVSGGRVDIGRFAELAREAGATRMCAAIIQRTSDLRLTDGSRELLSVLDPPRAWLVANRLVDSCGRLHRAPESSIAPGALLSAGRESVTATAAALLDGWREAIAARRRRASGTGDDPLSWTRMPEHGTVEEHRRRYFDSLGSADATSAAARRR